MNVTASLKDFVHTLPDSVPNPVDNTEKGRDPLKKEQKPGEEQVQEEVEEVGSKDNGEHSLPRDDYVLQVEIDPQMKANRRRKSSLVQRNIIGSKKGGSCFVHQLLSTDDDSNGRIKSTESNKEDGPSESVPLFAPVFEGLDVEKEEEHASVGKNILYRVGASQRQLTMLTKHELNDMVLGVRELSKYLASVCIKMNVRNVFVLTKIWDKNLVCYTRKLSKWLLENGYTVHVEESFRTSPQFDAEGLLASLKSLKQECSRNLKYWTPELCAKEPSTFDFILTLGGDGTVLYASSLFQQVIPPVLSFALGSLGFLTVFDFANHAEILDSVFNEGVTVGLRLRFEGRIMRSIPKEGSPQSERDLSSEILKVAEGGKLNSHKPDGSMVVLNEIVVDRGPNPTMSSMELYGDDMLLSSIAADGICIATPTGSTAYNLAAGGSLCHPELPGMLVTVICAHTLTFRPLILPDNIVLKVGVPYNARETAWVSFDGRQRRELHQGDYVTIVASQYPLPTVQMRKDNKDWFHSLSRTMNWGHRIQQKAFDTMDR